MSNHMQNSHSQTSAIGGVGIDHHTQGLHVPDSTDSRRLSVRELWGKYPKAKSTIKNMLKEQIEADRQIVKEHRELKEKLSNELYQRVSIVDLDIYVALAYSVARKDWIDEENRWVEDRLEENERLWFRWFAKGSGNGDFEEKKARARAYPIGNLMKINPYGNSKCPFHNDRLPSFKVYKNNTWFDFGGCGGGDVIAFYQKLNNVGFREAIEALS